MSWRRGYRRCRYTDLGCDAIRHPYLTLHSLLIVAWLQARKIDVNRLGELPRHLQ